MDPDDFRRDLMMYEMQQREEEEKESSENEERMQRIENSDNLINTDDCNNVGRSREIDYENEIGRRNNERK